MSKKQITWDRDQRAIAKKEQRTLFAIGIDGRENESSKVGQWISTGAVPEQVALQMYEAVMSLYREWYEAQDQGATP